MCGLVGFMLRNAHHRGRDGILEVLQPMASSLSRRGPDDSGLWSDEAYTIAFGHRRLAIQDISPAGHQPMQSVSGRYVVAFNGEIYNHFELRNDLGKLSSEFAWRGHSDTETLLAAIEAWGLDETLQRTVGMFAIALWDREAKSLTLVRDRFGEKPLYYGWVGSGTRPAFVFGSELKALRSYAGFDSAVCRQALVQYLRFMYVPAPRSIYQGIYKLEPGCLLTVQGKPPAIAPTQPLRPGQTHDSIQVRRWWSLAEKVVTCSQNPITNEADALRLLEEELSHAVSQQSLADVPLGAFLSGGVDSSTIVALMQCQSSRPVKTFTIGFEEAGFDESSHALAVARHLGTEHHELRVTAQMAQQVIPLLPHIYDEPFADSSQIPTHLVCNAARQHVTVALSGDAGDELFGGYNRYFWGPRIWRRLSRFPLQLRKALGRGVAAVPPSFWDIVGAQLGFGRGTGGVAHMGDKLHKLAGRLQTVRNINDLYLSLVSEWQDPSKLVLGGDGAVVHEPLSLLDDPLPALSVDNEQLWMMYCDTLTYLPDDILCKVDRAAMASSLETRVPFLDHRVVELAWRIPLSMKIHGNEGKWALRQVLYRHVPRELIERPKAGFSLPIGQWLRGPLRPWAESLLDENRLHIESYFQPKPIRQKWAEHLGGQRDHSASLWAVLMFQSWLANIEGRS